MGLMGEGRPIPRPVHRPKSVTLLPPPKNQYQPPPTTPVGPEIVVNNQSNKKSKKEQSDFDKSLTGQMIRLFEFLVRKSWFGWMAIAISYFIGGWVFHVKPLYHYPSVLAGFAYFVWMLGWGSWVKYGYLIDQKEHEYYGHNNVFGFILMLLGGFLAYAPDFLSSGEYVLLPEGVIIVMVLFQVAWFFLPSFDEAGPAFMREMYVAGLILLAGLMRVIGPGWW